MHSFIVKSANFCAPLRAFIQILMLNPNNSSLHCRLLNIACDVQDRPLRECIQRIASQLVHNQDHNYTDRVQVVADIYRDAIRSEYSSAQYKHYFQRCLDECRGELSHIEFFNLELPF